MLAIDQFVELLPSLAESREVEQAARVRTDADLLPLLRKAMEPAYPLPRYLAAHDILVEAFGIEEAFGQRRKILVITGDALTERMAGPAIRAWNIAAGPGRPSTTSGSSPPTRSRRRRPRRSASAPASTASWRRRSSGPTSSSCRATCWSWCRR